MSHSISHQQLAEIVGGELVHGDPQGIVTGMNSLTDALPGEVTFFGNARYLAQLGATKATAVLVPGDFQDFSGDRAYIRVANPTVAFSVVIKHFAPPAPAFEAGVHPSAVIAETAIFNPEKISIGPHVVIQDNVTIGDGTVIQAGVFIGYGTTIGEDCYFHSNCSIRERTKIGHRVVIHSCTAIGTDGFGYEFSNGRHNKVEQLGVVQIDDDVEIGSCSVIDRARFGRTWIGAGTKIDNLVQVAHNVVIGKHCIICGQTGIAGSTHIGDYCTFAGQVATSGHLRVSDKVIALGRTVITKDITQPGMYLGCPAKPVSQGRKLMTASTQIPEMLDRIRQLEKKIAQLESHSQV